MKIDDRRLFLKYALPCAETLVKRGDVSKGFADRLIDSVAKGKAIPRDGERIFKTALGNCEELAKKMGRKSIDADVIRRYFLVEHMRVVDSRFREKGDFDPVTCNTYVGKVVRAAKKFAVVKTRLGRTRYRKDFVPDLKAGEMVVVHRNFIVEKSNKNIEELVE